MTIIEQFLGHEASPLIQFIKYGIGGGIATMTHILIFHAFAIKLFPALQEKDFAVTMLKLDVSHLDDATRSRNSMIDNALGFMFSNMVAYIINIAWVFEAGRHHWAIEIILFYLVSGISMVIGTVLMGILIRRFGTRTTYAFMINIVVAVLINYAVRKFVIFNG